MNILRWIDWGNVRDMLLCGGMWLAMWILGICLMGLIALPFVAAYLGAYR